jgi:hypothetical protein
MSRPKLDLNQLWAQFNSWSERYIAKCDAEIERLAAKGDGWMRDIQFMTEQKGDFWDDQDVDVVMRKAIIRRKAAFLRVYLRDLSFDGAAFMKRHMRLLPMQLPLRKRTGVGVWLVEDQERKHSEPNASTEFLEPYVSLFAKEVSDIDFASAHNVLPFDHLLLQNFTGKKWTKLDACRIANEIKADLEFDGMEFDLKFSSTPQDLALTFVWDPSDPPSSEEDAPLATKKSVSKTTKKPKKPIAKSVSKEPAAAKVATRASPKQKVARIRGARRDASIGAITKRIQKAFKLPDGSVKLVLPSGRKAHIDGRIKNLLAQWDKD